MKDTAGDSGENRVDRDKSDLEIAATTAEHIMTSPAVACREEAYFEEIAEILADRNISGMPVVDADGKVLGMISERDLAHALGSPLVRLAVRRYQHGPMRRERTISQMQRHAGDIMTAPAIAAAPGATLPELARLMVENHLNRLPILRDGRLVGVVTRGDVLGAMGGLRRGPSDRDGKVLTFGTPGVGDSRISLDFENDQTHQEESQ